MKSNFDKLKKDEQNRCYASIEPLLALEKSKVTGKIIAREAKKQRIHAAILTKRYQIYLAKDFDGLYPSGWKEPAPETWELIQIRRIQLGTEANKHHISNKDIEKVAKRNEWSFQKAERLLKQYREGGWLAFDSTRKRRRKRHSQRKITAWGITDLSPAKVAYQKLSIIEPLLELVEDITKAVKHRAEQVGLSEKTLWNYLRDYRDDELEGLTRRKRKDTGQFRGITEEMVDLVKQVRIANSCWSAVAVQKEVERIVSGTGDVPASLSQVREIIKTISPAVLAVADGRLKEFKNRYEVVGYQPKPHDRVIWQLDDTPAAWMLKDLRPDSIRNKSGQFRPLYASVIDTRSHCSLANHFWYDDPDRHTAAALIRDAILAGGVPHEIHMDSGRYLLADHVHDFLKSLNIKFVHRKHQPQQNGIIESWWQKVEKEFFSTMEGYTGPDVKRRNQHLEVKWDIYDADQKLKQYVDSHNNKNRDEGGRTPAEIYQDIPTRQVNPRLLDILLLEAERREVRKDGISFRGETFSNPGKLHKFIGRSVLIRGRPTYERNNYIEVFSNDKWICRAYNYRKLTKEEVVQAKKDQRLEIRDQIRSAKETYAKAIEKVGPRYPVDQSMKPPSARTRSNRKVSRKKSITKGKAIVQRMITKSVQQERKR